jgi:hypothetical protein
MPNKQDCNTGLAARQSSLPARLWKNGLFDSGRAGLGGKGMPQASPRQLDNKGLRDKMALAKGRAPIMEEIV